MHENSPFDDFPDVSDLVSQYEEMERNNAALFLEEEAFEQLIEFYETEEKNVKASHVVDHALAQYPFSAYFHIKKAQFLFDIRQFDQALAYLDKAQLFDAQDIQIYLLRSDIYVWMESFKKAVETIEHAITIAPAEDISDLYLELADIYEEWEKYDLVFENLKKSLDYDISNEEALNRLWFCVEFIEKYQESVEFHQAVIDKDPYNYLAWFNLAHAFSGLGLYEKAVDAFDYVLAINENYEYAYKDCGDVLFRMEDYKKAIEYYKNGLSLTRPSKEILFNIGECYECLNDMTKARSYYRKAINIDPHFHEAFFRTGLCYRAEDKWNNALSSFERAFKLKDDDPDYIEALADTCYELSDLDSAIELFRKAVDIRPNSREAWLALARTLLESGMYRESFVTLDEALEQFDNPPDITYVKSAYYYLVGNKKEALIHLEYGLLIDYKLHPIVYEIAATMQEDAAVQQVILQYAQ